MFLYIWLQNIDILQKREKQNAISTKKLGFGNQQGPSCSIYLHTVGVSRRYTDYHQGRAIHMADSRID